MSKVYGVGLPRTGTTSLAKALEILGYDVAHYCPITNPSTRDELNEEHQAFVSSELLMNPTLDRGKWIVLHRPQWYESMWNLGQDICQWQDHIAAWKQIENVERENVLHYNITEGWDKLCAFLNVAVPACEFPFSNKG